MMSHRSIEVRDGVLGGLWVAGFHGEIEPALTPARRGPVFVDAENHAVIVTETEGGQAFAEVSETVIRGRESLEGAWTPTHRYPATIDGLFLILGPDERFRLKEVFALSHPAESSGVSDFLRWMASDTVQGKGVSAERQRSTAGDGDLSIWYCSPGDADEVTRRYGEVYTKELLKIAREADATKIERAAFRLWRASTTAEDIYLVAAALQKIGYRRRRWEELLREGAREATSEERVEGVEKAKRTLEAVREKAAPSAVSYPRRGDLRRPHLVKCAPRSASGLHPPAAAARAEARIVA